MVDFTSFFKTLRSIDNSIPEDEEEVVEEVEEVDADGLTVEERLAANELDLEAFLKRAKTSTAKTNEQLVAAGEEPVDPDNIDLTRTNPDGSVNVTEQVTAAREPTRDYDFFYGEKPPKLSWLDSTSAVLGDLFNNDVQSGSQIERDEYKTKLEEFDKNAKKIYENSVEYTLPEVKAMGIDLTFMADDELFADNKLRVYKYLDADGEVAMTLVPNPTSNAFTRILGQASRTIWTEIAGLVEREDDGSLDLNYLEDSEYSKAVPDLDQGMGEGLLTDLLVFGVPGVAAEKAGRGLTKTVLKPLVDNKIVKKADDLLGTSVVGNFTRKAADISGNAITYMGGSLAVALTEGVLSEEGDQGLIFDEDMVTSVFTGVDPEEAKDLAMIFDGFVVNGLFDTVLGLGIGAGKMVQKRFGDIRGFVDPTFVKDKSKRAAFLSVITEIDPALANASPRDVAEGFRTLAVILQDNAETLATVGKTTNKVEVDTVNALAAGAKKYIQITRQTLENSMTPEKWAKYVEDEANALVSRTIAIARGNSNNTLLREQQANMLNNISNTFAQESDRINPTKINFDTDTVPNLSDARQLEINEIEAEALAAKTQAEDFRTESGLAVEKDPLVKEMLSDVDPSRFFDDREYVAKLTELYGETFVDSYRAAYDSVRVAYEAIPNDPIDMIAFKTQLANVFTSAGGLGEVTQDGAPIIAKLQQVFGGKITSKTDNLNLAALEGGNTVTPQSLIDGLSDDIGFQDLYALKKELDKMISATNNRNVSTALQDLRKHITSKMVDPDTGEAIGQLAFVSKNGGEDTARLAQAADDLFIETQSKFQNSTTTQTLSNNANLPAYAGSNTTIPEGGSRRGQPDLETQAVEGTDAILSDRTNNQLQQLQFSLSDSLAKGEVNKPFIDLFVAEQTDRLAKALRNNDTQTIQEIDDAFEGIIKKLQNLDSPLVEELNTAKRRILTVQDELGDRALAADEVARMAMERKVKAETTIVAQFLSSVGPGAKSNPSMTLTRLLSGDDAGGVVDALLREIDKLPIDQQGPARTATQSVLLRSIHDMVRTATDIAPGGKKDVALGALAKLTNERRSGLVDAVARAFPDDEYMKETMMLTLGSLQDVSLSARMKIARSGSDTAANLKIGQSMSTGILFVFGYMNPTAAAARKLSGAQIEAMERISKEEGDKIVGLILANPKGFAEIAKMIADGVEPAIWKRNTVDFLNVANRTIQYRFRTDDENNQTANMLLDSASSLLPQ